MLQRLKLLGGMLVVTIIGMLSGCRAEPLKKTSVGKFSMLSQTESRQYVSDWQHVRKLATTPRALELNLADPVQYRFLERRLKLAGLNNDSSPALFARLAVTRARQSAPHAIIRALDCQHIPLLALTISLLGAFPLYCITDRPGK